MSVKLGRVVFRKIGGRIIPIRIGAEAKTLAAGLKGVSSKAVKQLKLLTSQGRAAIKSGKLVSAEAPSSSEAMMKFVEKTGAIRFHKSGDSLNLDFLRKLSSEQKMTIASNVPRPSAIYADAKSGSGEFKSLGDFVRSHLQWGSKEFKPSKIAEKLQSKAIKEYGLTGNIDEAGYIFRDGSMLDLSGKRMGGPPGTRSLDHREISHLVKVNPKKLSDREISWGLSSAQMARKASASKLHEITTLKSDIGKIGSDFELADIKKSMIKELNRLVSAKRKK